MDRDRTVAVFSCLTALDPRSSTENLGRLEAAVAAAADPEVPAERRVVVLPERWWRDDDEAGYREAVAGLARRVGAWVVGGSMHRRRGEGRENAGVAVEPSGRTAGEYSKRHPFSGERLARVAPGGGPQLLEVAGLRVLVVICADLFDPALFVGGPETDLILVAAASTSRRPEPDFARALWMHTAVVRAWERNAHLVVSDWAAARHQPGVRTCGVSGRADPTRPEPPLFEPATAPGCWFGVEPGGLADLAEDRRRRNFLFR